MEIRLDSLPSGPAALQEMVRALTTELRSRDTLIDRLKAQLAKLRRSQFGRSSEKLVRAIEQLELALEDVEATLAERHPVATNPFLEEAKAKPARKTLPDHLQREELRHEAGVTCPDCGGRDLRTLGEDISEALEFVPASFRVVRHDRPRLACRECDAQIQAVMPGLAIERGKPGPGLLAHILTAKVDDHVPRL